MSSTTKVARLRLRKKKKTLNNVKGQRAPRVETSRIFCIYAKNNGRNVCIYAKFCVTLHIERWGAVSRLWCKISKTMETKRISLSRKEWMMICFALADGIRTRQELADNCISAAESGVQSVDKQEKWIEYANRAEREMNDFRDLRDKIRNKMYK